ncbi:MAG TPA: DUF3592 domain-containing protein [Chitinophaga sp.]|uniref:DUF3592 domain-containing protein n=1 Tax=Chitinophaga sp. TaxID=1869181 RepID=UPI002F925E9E
MPELKRNVFLLIGAVLVILFLVLTKKARKVMNKGIQVQGVVFDIVSGSTDQAITQHPVIRFLTINNVWITEPYYTSTFPVSLKKGQTVKVVYSPRDPKSFIIKPEGIALYLPLGILMLGSVFLIAGVYKLLRP